MFKLAFAVCQNNLRVGRGKLGDALAASPAWDAGGKVSRPAWPAYDGDFYDCFCPACDQSPDGASFSAYTIWKGRIFNIAAGEYVATVCANCGTYLESGVGRIGALQGLLSGLDQFL